MIKNVRLSAMNYISSVEERAIVVIISRATKSGHLMSRKRRNGSAILPKERIFLLLAREHDAWSSMESCIRTGERRKTGVVWERCLVWIQRK